MKTYPGSFRYCKATVIGRPDSQDGHRGSQVVASTGEPSSSPHFSTHNLLPVLSPSRLALIFFFSVYMGLTCSSSLSLWKSNPGSKEIQSIEVRIRIKEQDSNSALAGLYGHSSVRCSLFSHVWLFETLWIVALQAPLSIEFSRQEYYIQWVAMASSRDRTPAPLCFQHWQVGSLPLAPPGKPYKNHNHHLFCAWVVCH